MSLEIRKDNIGIQFVVNVKDGDDPEDISAYTTRQIIIRKPNGSILTKTATLSTDGTDGACYCVSEDGDLDLVGVYRLQIRLSTSSVDYTTNIGSFRVSTNLT